MLACLRAKTAGLAGGVRESVYKELRKTQREGTKTQTSLEVGPVRTPGGGRIDGVDCRAKKGGRGVFATSTGPNTRGRTCSTDGGKGGITG